MEQDFMRLAELSKRSGLRPQTIYRHHCTGRGVLVPILTKFGGRLGCWRADWRAFTSAQLKLAVTELGGEGMSAADVQAAMVIRTRRRSNAK
jgi:hypothetical protein